MGIILSFCEFWLPFQDLTNCSLDLPSGSLFAQKHLWNGVMVVIKIVPGVWVWCWGPKPLNSSTLEFLLGNQVKFRCFLFGGVVTVISTSLLSSWSICYAGGSVLTAPGSAKRSCKQPCIAFFAFCTGYDLRLWMRSLSCQQAQVRRWWMGSLKFAIGLEPPSLRILAGGLYFVFPSSALVLLDRSP